MRFKWSRKTSWRALWCVTGVFVLVFAPVIFVFAWHATHSANQEFAGYRFTVPRGFAHIPQARAMLEGARKL
ncbi:MAG: hypothetical protein ACLQHF_12460 [Terracidiphilus sp.]